jgi:hypothetical protein
MCTYRRLAASTVMLATINLPEMLQPIHISRITHLRTLALLYAPCLHMARGKGVLYDIHLINRMCLPSSIRWCRWMRKQLTSYVPWLASPCCCGTCGRALRQLPACHCRHHLLL